MVSTDAISRHLGASDVELGIAGAVFYRVYIRNAAYQRIAELTDWSSLHLVLKFNDVGTWALETSADSVEARLLTKSGGIIVTRELNNVERTIFSGFVWTEYGFTATTFRAAGYSDDALLWQPARPTPSLPFAPWPDQYDVRTGTASTIMRQLVDANLGPSAPVPWKVDALTLAPDPLLGNTITARANLQPIITVLAELAITPYAGGLGFRVIQSDVAANSVAFEVYAPEDKSADAMFSIELGTAQDYDDTESAPEANHVIVMGGDGLGNQRTITEAADSASIAEWGRRIATVIDMRGTTDTSELLIRAAEEIAKVSTLRRVAVTPFEVPSLQYGLDYDLGTLVTVVTHGGETVDLIRQVEIDMDPERGISITPVVGQGDGSDEERSQTMVRTIQGRISNLERNWTVPDNSITNAMLYPTVRPPIGEVKWLAGSAVPGGHLLCNGQAVSRTSYALLWNTIGTAWGAGDGSTTFNVPNLIDRSPIGSGSTYALAQLVGSATASIPAHTHTGALHTHPGSHSHGLASHTHPGASHTHPGSHSHGAGTLAISHDHSVDINHDHASFTSGGENTFAATFSTYPGTTTNVSHNHNVDVPALGTNTKTSGGAANISRSGSTDTDSNAPAASAGSTGVPSPGSTDTDSNAPAASFSAQTGSSGASSSVSIVHPSAGLLPVIYAGV
jgi:microcystin-dependent protein